MTTEEIFDLQQKRMMKRKEKISMINVVLQNTMHFLKFHFIQTCMHKKNNKKIKKIHQINLHAFIHELKINLHTFIYELKHLKFSCILT